LAVNVIGFAALLPVVRPLLPAITIVLVPLTLLAAALELLISTWCRNLKEAHTYLSLIAFLPMAAGMFLVFFPHVWPVWYVVPIAGHQLVIGSIAKGAAMSPALLPALTIVTLTATCAILATASYLLERDEIVYGG